MSDTFTSSFSDILANSPQVGDLPSFQPSDFAFSPGSFNFADFFGNAGGAPLLPPVQNLPATGSTGLTGFLRDAAKLATTIYEGEAQVAAAQSAGQVAKARTAQQIANLSSQPSPWLILGIVGAGFLAFHALQGGPPVQSVVSTTRRNR